MDDATLAISIHAPRAGSDLAGMGIINPYTGFQSTLPVRGATEAEATEATVEKISIHAPRAGSDGKYPHGASRLLYFNPRSPCGERQQICTNTHLQIYKI